jgi:hypothetical protein
MVELHTLEEKKFGHVNAGPSDCACKTHTPILTKTKLSEDKNVG